MIGTKYRFTPKYTPNNVQEAIAGPLKELAGDIKAQDAANAAARKAAMAKRNQQYNKLYSVAGKGFEGWSKQHIDEFENQFNQSLEMAMNAPDDYSANAITAREALRLGRLHSAGEDHARLMVSQNSAHDQYIQWHEGSKPWAVDGETPLTSDFDLQKKEYNWDNSTINIRKENVGGYDTSVGDYVSPRGVTYREEVEKMFTDNGIEFREYRDTDGITYIAPVNPELGKEVAVSGPMMLHPGLGNRLYFHPESVKNTVTYTDFAAIKSLQTAIDEIQKLYTSDVNRISFEEANSRARAAAMTLFNSNPTFAASANAFYKEKYGVDFDPKDFEIDPITQMSVAEVEGRRPPKELYLDSVMSIVGFNKQIPQGSSGSGTRKLQWADVDKANKIGIPENITYEENEAYLLNTYSAEDKAIIESLNNEPRIDLTFPEEINLQFNGEKVNTIRMYSDAGYMLVERVNADTVGEPMDGWENTPEQDGPSLYDKTSPEGLWNYGGWKKKPEPKYFVVPIFGSDGDYSDPFKQLERNVVSEYIRSGDFEEGAIPLRNIYKGGI